MNWDIIRKELYNDKMNQSQVDGINCLLTEFDVQKVTDKRRQAYVLATVYHETAKKMQPVKEFGSQAYLMSKAYYPYYGRDLCQTTWKVNYEKVKKFTGIDVVTNPDLIGQQPLAAKVCVKFMTSGWYTTKKLSDYFNDTKEDWINARRIINGTDKAQDIANYAVIFYNALIN